MRKNFGLAILALSAIVSFTGLNFNVDPLKLALSLSKSIVDTAIPVMFWFVLGMTRKKVLGYLSVFALVLVDAAFFATLAYSTVQDWSAKFGGSLFIDVIVFGIVLGIIAIINIFVVKKEKGKAISSEASK